MGIFLWDSAPSKIFVGDTEVSKVFVWDTQVRPNLPIQYTITWSTLDSQFYPSEGSDIQWCYINPTGTKMYVDFWSNKTLWEYDLSTPRNIGTATAVQSLSVNTPDGIRFDNTWTYMFIWCESPSSIKRYTLSTPRDISTATEDQSLSISNSRFPYNINLSPDGLHLNIFYPDSNRVNKFSTVLLNNTFDLTSVVSRNTYDLSWNLSSDGSLFFKENQGVAQYKLSSPYDPSNLDNLIGAYMVLDYDLRAFWVKEDKSKWIIALGWSWNGAYINLYNSVLV